MESWKNIRCIYTRNTELALALTEVGDEVGDEVGEELGLLEGGLETPGPELGLPVGEEDLSERASASNELKTNLR